MIGSIFPRDLLSELYINDVRSDFSDGSLFFRLNERFELVQRLI